MAAGTTKPTRTISVAMDDNYPPYVFRNDQGQLEGITVDQWRLWEKQTGIKVELHAMDWGGVVRRMHAGEFDVIDTIFENEPRKEFLDFTPPYASLKVPIFFRAEISGIKDIDSLKGFPVAVKTGDNAVEVLRRNGIGPLQLFNNYQAIVAAAKERKVNIFVIDAPPAIYLLNKAGIAGDFRMSAPIYVGEFHRAVHKGNQQLLEEIERGFAAIDPAELKRIDRKWRGQRLDQATYLRGLGYAALLLLIVAALFAGWSWALNRSVRRRTRELRESEERWKFALAGAGDGVWDLAVPTREVHFSRRWKEMLGYEEEEIPNRFEAWERLVHPDDRSRVQAYFETYLRSSGGQFGYEHRLRAKDGSYRWILVRGTAVSRDETGRPLRMVGTHTDITERKLAEEAQRASEARLRTILESEPEWVSVIGPDGQLLEMNGAGLSMLECSTVDEVKARSWSEWIAPDYQAGFMALHRKAMAGAKGAFAFEAIGRSGTRRWLELHAAPLRDASGKVTSVLGVARDVTERHKAEESLQLLSQSVAHASESIFQVSAEGRLLYVNEAACRQLGYARAELLGMTISEVEPDAAPEKWKEHWEEVKQRGSMVFESRQRTKAGVIIPVETNASYVRAGERELIFKSVRDIRGRKATEERIRHLNRVYAILSEINQTIVREHDTQAVLEAACRIAVEKGRFALAWIGLLEEANDLKIAAHAGAAEDTLQILHAFTSGEHPGCDFTEEALRTGHRSVCNSIAALDAAVWWRAPALERGYRSMISLPLKAGAETTGVFNLYAAEEGFFDAEELGLIEELMADIGYALKVRRDEAERSRFADVIEATLNEIYIFEGESLRFEHVNAGACKNLGYTAEQMRQMTPLDIKPEFTEESFRALIAPLRRHETEKIVFHAKHLRANGTVYPVEVNLQLVEEHDRQSLVAVVLDLTERQQIETRLRFMSLAVEHAGDGMFWISPEGKVLYANAAACRNLGYTKIELLRMKVSDFDFDYQADRWPQHWEELKRCGTMIFETRHRAKDGTIHPVEINANYVRAGEHEFNFAFVRDIGERKAAEARIKRLNRVYTVLSAINEAIIREKNSETLLQTSCRIAVEEGHFRMAWIGMLDPVSGRVRPVASAGVVDGYLDDLEIVPSDGERSRGPTSQAFRLDRYVICSDIESDPMFAPWREAARQRGYCATGAFPLRMDGKVVGTINLYAGASGAFDAEEIQLLDKLATDISFALEFHQREAERRRAEEELRWRTAMFEAQMDSAVDGILVVDEDGKKIVQNRRINEIFKIPEEIANDPDASRQIEFVTSRTKAPEASAAKVAELYAHPDAISRDLVELVDGTILDRASAPVRDKAGNYYGRIWVFRDITERRRLEEQLRQSQKMEAIGQLAGGVAHDFNNILAAIMMQAELASRVEPLADEAQEMLNEIKVSTERAANLTRQLLAFSRRTVMQPRFVDVNEIVTNLSKMLRRLLGENVSLRLDLSARPLTTRGDPGMLDQVLLNLVVNARDAMPEGGRLTIRTGERELSEEDARAIAEAEPGRYVRVQVADTGCGIPPENLPHIFEPFFTTKPPGEGSGLGLATVFGIVRQHGGFVTLSSEVGHGTTFEVLLRAEAAPVATTETPQPVKSQGGSETILLVEDEDAVRMLTRMVLERAGYTVIEAANGPEALEAWQKSRGKPDLILTDIVMPEGIGGRELAAELKADKATLAVIFTSGYSANIATRGLALGEREEFVQKPCPPQILLSAVRRILDS